MAIDLLCVGAANLDVIVSVDDSPGPDGRVEAREILRAGGGPAATAAVAAARQGISVGFCGSVGRDAEGEAILEGLIAEGVDVRHVARERDVPSGSSVIVVSLSTAERMICARTAPPPPRIPETTGWVHVDQVGYACLDPITRARSLVSIDHGNPIHDVDLTQIALYVPTRAMLQATFHGEMSAASRAAHHAGADSVVVTDGARGSWFLDADTLVLSEAFALEGQLSTLGAGDVFHGALLSALITGADLPHAVQYANAAAALSCRGLDGRSAIPSPEDVERLLSSRSSTSSQPNGTERQS